MTLPASGSISFSQLQTEFGGSNPISLSEYIRGGSYVPDSVTNSGIVTSTNNSSLSKFYSGSKIFGLLGTIGSGSTYYTTTPPLFDSSNNSYTFASAGGGVGASNPMIKYSSSGVLQFQKSETATTTGFDIRGGTIDANNNIYVVGSAGTSGQPAINKFDTNGNSVWNSILQYTGFTGVFYDVAVDSGGSVYAVGNGKLTGSFNYMTTFIARFNSDGSLAWAKPYRPTNDRGTALSVSIDSADNIYIGGYVYIISTTSVSHPYVMKLGPSGGIFWQYVLQTSADSYGTFYGGRCDSSGNMYALATDYSAGVILSKFNSSGTLQWQRALGYSGDSIYSDTTAQGVTIDETNGHVYVAVTDGNTNSKTCIIKLDTNGNLVWGRQFALSGGYVPPHGISMNKDKTKFCVSIKQYNTGLAVLSLPVDGSKMGTYSLAGKTYTYSEKIPTVNNISFPAIGSSIAEYTTWPWSNTSFTQLTATSSFVTSTFLL